MPKPTLPFARYVSAKAGFSVSRYGSGTAQSRASQFGVTVDPVTREQTWDEDVVYALGVQEAALYAREYDRHVKAGELAERTEADYLASCEAARKRAAETQKKIDEDAKAAKAEAEAAKVE
jgi:hypothetical protein